MDDCVRRAAHLVDRTLEGLAQEATIREAERRRERSAVERAYRVVELFVDGSIPRHVGESVEVAVQLAQCDSDSLA